MKTWLAVLIVCLMAPCLLAGPGSNTASVTVGWSYDFVGNPGVTNFVVYWGPATRTYTNHADAGTNLTFTITNLVRGATYYFAATAQAGTLEVIESDYSNEASKVIPMKPAKPVNFIAQ